eukprot:m.123414 g.123414  ORF g.123414 m.123414 type:complete len:195 (-) comp14446_c0_seq2:1314-1898(-)
MIICIGPICIPIYGLIPFVLFVFRKVYSWITGEPVEKESKFAEEIKAKELENQEIYKGEQEVSVQPSAEGVGLRHRNVNEATEESSVKKISSRSEWIDTLALSITKNNVVLVKFTAPWCKPCKAIAPAYEALSKTSPKNTFVEINTDELKDVMKDAEVGTLPTFQVYRGSKLINSLEGKDEKALEELVAKYDTH